MTSPDGSQYNADYYERGVAKGISGYTDYRWRPEYVLPFANELKRRYLCGNAGGTVLDFGCAKGFLVQALRLLGIEAYGYDISSYAVQNSDPGVAKYLSNQIPSEQFSLVVAKDTLEHVPHDRIDETLKALWKLTRWVCVVVVPLGDNGLYRIREYELDKTHQIREDERWWADRFNAAGFGVSEFHYDFPHAKDHWLKVHPHGNGTFVLSPFEIFSG